MQNILPSSLGTATLIFQGSLFAQKIDSQKQQYLSSNTILHNITAAIFADKLMLAWSKKKNSK